MGLMSFPVRSVFGLGAGRLWLSVCWLLALGRGAQVPRNTAPSRGALPRCGGGLRPLPVQPWGAGAGVGTGLCSPREQQQATRFSGDAGPGPWAWQALRAPRVGW